MSATRRCRLGFALIPEIGHPTLFVDREKLGDKEHAALSKLATIAEPNSVETVLAALGKTGKSVLLRCRNRAVAPQPES